MARPKPVSQGSSLVDITVDDSQVQHFVSAIEHTIQGASLFYFLRNATLPYLRKRAKERFEKEGDDVSGPWFPLAEATQEIREQLGYGREHPINKRTGQLERYILAGGRLDMRVGPKVASMSWPGKPPTLGLKQKVETAQGMKPGVPARPVLGMNATDTITVLGMLGLWIGEQVDRYNRGLPSLPGVP